jgi:hypothetical protein
MNYWQAIDLAKASVDDEDFRIYGVSTRPVSESEEETQAVEEYFETLPEAHVYFDGWIAGDSGEEYVIELGEWAIDPETGGLKQVGVLKTRTEFVAA